MGLNLFAPAPMFPLIMEDYGLSRGAVSLLMVVAFTTFTVSLIPGGVICSRLGTRNAVLLSGLLMTAGILAPATSNLAALLPLRVAFGVGNAILLPATAAMIVQWFKLGERPVMNAVTLALQGSGVATAMFLSVPLAEAIEWQTVLMVYGIVASIGTVTWLALGRSTRPGAAPAEPVSARAVFGVLKEKNTLLLAFAFVGPFALFIGFSSWLPTYYNEVFEMPLQQATSLLALLPLMGIVVNVLSGFLLARLGLHRPLLILPGMLLPIGGFGAFYFDSIPIIVASIVVMGFCFWLFLPTALTIAMELPGVTLEKVALVTAGALTIGNASTIVSPLLVGIVTDMLGTYVPMLSALAVFSCTAAIAAIKLPETGHRAKRPVSIR